MIAKVRIHSLEAGSFQFSHIPAIPNGAPSFMAIAYGCFAFWPLMAFHSKKPSTGTMQRRLRYASRNVGRFRTVSYFPLIGLRPPVGPIARGPARPPRFGDCGGCGLALHPPRRIIVHTAVTHVHTVDDGISKRSAALDDPPTHSAD